MEPGAVVQLGPVRNVVVSGRVVGRVDAARVDEDGAGVVLNLTIFEGSRLFAESIARQAMVRAVPSPGIEPGADVSSFLSCGSCGGAEQS